MKFVATLLAAVAVLAGCASCPEAEPVSVELDGCAPALVAAQDEYTLLQDERRLLRGQVETLRTQLATCQAARAEADAARAALEATTAMIRAAMEVPSEGTDESTDAP